MWPGGKSASKTCALTPRTGRSPSSPSGRANPGALAEGPWVCIKPTSAAAPWSCPRRLDLDRDLLRTSALLAWDSAWGLASGASGLLAGETLDALPLATDAWVPSSPWPVSRKLMLLSPMEVVTTGWECRFLDLDRDILLGCSIAIRDSLSPRCFWAVALLAGET